MDIARQPYAKQVTVSLPLVLWELAWYPEPGKLRKKLGLFFRSLRLLLLGRGESGLSPRYLSPLVILNFQLFSCSSPGQHFSKIQVCTQTHGS